MWIIQSESALHSLKIGQVVVTSPSSIFLPPIIRLSLGLTLDIYENKDSSVYSCGWLQVTIVHYTDR